MPFPAIPPPIATKRPPEPVYGDPYLDGQMSLRELILDPRRGSRIRLLRADWHGIRDMRETDEERSGMHGVWSGRDLLPGLQLAMTVRIYGESAVGAQLLLRHLTSAFAPSDEPVPLLHRRDGVTLLRWVKPRLADPDESRIGLGLVDVTCGVLAVDPAYYTARASTVSATLGAPGGGITPPLTPPLALPARPGAGTSVVYNRGSWPTPPVLTITGPISQPGVTSNDWVLVYDLDLADGQTLTIDTAAGAATLGDSAYRSPVPGSSITSDCTIPPGVATLRLLGQATHPTRRPRLDVAVRDAWI